jgi:hypothetical protein
MRKSTRRFTRRRARGGGILSKLFGCKSPESCPVNEPGPAPPSRSGSASRRNRGAASNTSAKETRPASATRSATRSARASVRRGEAAVIKENSKKERIKKLTNAGIAENVNKTFEEYLRKVPKSDKYKDMSPAEQRNVAEALTRYRLSLKYGPLTYNAASQKAINDARRNFEKHNV